MDILAYFTGRYFGMQAFREDLRSAVRLVLGGRGLGPFLSGVAFEIQKTYDHVFLIYEVALLVACALIWSLGAYRYPAGGTKHDERRSRARGTGDRRA